MIFLDEKDQKIKELEEELGKASEKLEYKKSQIE